MITTSELPKEVVVPVTAAPKSDPWEMALIHRLITRGFMQAREFVLAEQGRRRTPSVAEYIEFHLDGLHAHHSTEDELIWPALHERAGLSGALIDRMEAQHNGVGDAVNRTRSLLLTWTDSPTSEPSQALADALAAVSEGLAEHLAEEERDVVPLIAEHITQAEWEHAGKLAFSKFTPKQRFIATGEMLAAATTDEANRMLGGLPAPIRLVWWLVGRRGYDRFMARVRG